MAIEDFGEKIGGAKKDLWRHRGLAVDDLTDMNEAERDKFIKKDNVWKKPDYQALVDSGLPVRVVYFMKMVRDATPTKPEVAYGSDVAEAQERYVNFVGDLRDAVMKLKTADDVLKFYDNFIKDYLISTGSYYVKVVPEAEGCINNKLLKAARVTSFFKIDREIAKKQFCYSETDKILSAVSFLTYSKDSVTFETDYNGRKFMRRKDGFGGFRCFYRPVEMIDPEGWEEGTVFTVYAHSGEIVARNFPSVDDAKEAFLASVKSKQEASKEEVSSTKGRKKRFTPPQLASVKREGPDYRHEKNMTGSDYLERFGFRGGEFGNWMSENDRQASLDFGYDALMDLSRTLGVNPLDISLNGRLSIAFGARGSGSALAHYESLREVINLTKMRGAGSLAHEWAHALDDALGKQLGLGGFATEHPYSKATPKSLNKLMDTMIYKDGGIEESLKLRNEGIERTKRNIKLMVNGLLPDSKLNDTQKAQKDKLLAEILDTEGLTPESRDRGLYSVNGDKLVDALSSLRKEARGRVIPKDDRILLSSYRIDLQRKATTEIKPIRINTDFYNGSVEFDNCNTKMGHGYWSSRIEMFARAFACYVSDKIDGRNDYLCGHANSYSVPVFNERTGESHIVSAIPLGEERAAINQCFDEFIEELKVMGLLNVHDYGKESFVFDAKAFKPAEVEPFVPKTLSIPSEKVHVEQLDFFDLFALSGVESGAPDVSDGIGGLAEVAQNATARNDGTFELSERGERERG